MYNARGWGLARKRRATVLAVIAAALVAPTSALADVSVTTSPADASLVSDTYALLSGTLNPDGNQVTYHFDWGRTSAYGQSTPETAAGNGKADVPVDVSLDDLQPSKKYHYRLAVTVRNADGSASVVLHGADQAFTTASPLGIAFVAKKAVVTRGKARVKIKAVGAVGDTAEGRLTLRALIGGHLRPVGFVDYKLDVGKTKAYGVQLNATGKNALRAAGRLVVTASAKTDEVKKPAVKHITLEVGR